VEVGMTDRMQEQELERDKRRSVEIEMRRKIEVYVF